MLRDQNKFKSSFNSFQAFWNLKSEQVQNEEGNLYRNKQLDNHITPSSFFNDPTILKDYITYQINEAQNGVKDVKLPNRKTVSNQQSYRKSLNRNSTNQVSAGTSSNISMQVPKSKLYQTNQNDMRNATGNTGQAILKYGESHFR